MRIIREVKVGDELWLGETCYRILEPNRDVKRKIVPGEWVAEPCAWTDRILNAPLEIRKFVKKTEQIIIKVPLRIYNHAE